MNNLKDLSIIIPVFNEEENISELYTRLSNAIQPITEDYELIFVNDGSSDGSLQKVQELSKQDNRVFFIDFSRNFGHQIALTAGLDFCNGKAVVIIDSDLQDPPELISELYNKYKEGFDIVYAQRERRRGESFLKKLTAKLFYRLFKRLVSFDIPLDAGDFRIFDRKIVLSLRNMTEQSKFLRGQMAWLGYKHTKVTYNRDSRKDGKTGYSYGKMITLAIDAITGFSDKPLAFVRRLGFFISFLSFLVILFAIFSHFVLKQTITGWTSLIVSVMFIGGIQLFSIGIIGEYISRINRDVKNRPLYIVDKTNIESNN
ncbi:glycosyltransferase family 2 protein [Ichthyenterobacterium sp. W332]|uniref:Glycosyltransferase family 2 protein n=1 Tax=Microcosmobacter mediterraneus TaxID=3075607 RepID=A0ABU2YN46_9FLAO|nr:glycosyltransferase family 2 protein [Ichthyenterobacterium sp. W332]MDT0559247.1 glycosyltransferase family 2 protein [Ichthyenterobacterium sp. W332]